MESSWEYLNSQRKHATNINFVIYSNYFKTKFLSV